MEPDTESILVTTGRELGEKAFLMADLMLGLPRDDYYLMHGAPKPLDDEQRRGVRQGLAHTFQTADLVSLHEVEGLLDAFGVARLIPGKPPAAEVSVLRSLDRPGIGLGLAVMEALVRNLEGGGVRTIVYNIRSGNTAVDKFIARCRQSIGKINPDMEIISEYTFDRRRALAGEK